MLLASLRVQPVPCLLMTLVQLGCACRCAAQLLQAHGPEEAVIQLCNATANVTADCVTPNHSLLTALVAFLSCVLLLMICSMALPLSTQNRLLRLLRSACGHKTRHISYIDAGLYKTKSAICRREVFVRHVWGNGRQRPPTDAADADADAPTSPPLPQQLPEPPHGPSQHPRWTAGHEEAAAACDLREVVPIRIEPAQEAEGAAAAAAAGTGCCWTELQCQHPALVCDALFCYRSDPNIRQSSATRLLGTEEETRRLLL